MSPTTNVALNTWARSCPASTRAVGLWFLPRQDALAYDEPAPSPEISGRRASVLRRLSLASKPPLLVATAEALIPRVPPADAWQFATLHIRTGDSIGQNEIEDFLARAGYSLEDRVDVPGSAMLLGQVVEIYPAGALDPVRISVTDGRISAIHSYDPDDKRELAELKELTLDPISEFRDRWPKAGPDSAVTYCPPPRKGQCFHVYALGQVACRLSGHVSCEQLDSAAGRSARR